MASKRRVRRTLDDLDLETPEAQVTRQAEELEDSKAQASQDMSGRVRTQPSNAQ